MKKEDLFKLSDPNFHESIGIMPKWRVGDSSGNQSNEIYPYYDSDQAEQILDTVAGVEGWGCEYREVAKMLFCSISINVDGELVEKSDAGGARASRKKDITEVDKATFEAKAAASGAFVRSAAKWGIGRHLALLPKITLKNAGQGVMIAPDGTKLSSPAELTAWCNKITPSIRYLITIYQLNKADFDTNARAVQCVTELKEFLLSLNK